MMIFHLIWSSQSSPIVKCADSLQLPKVIQFDDLFASIYNFLYLVVYAVRGTDPIKSLQCKFYAMQIFKHSDWLLKFFNQSGCLKISIA